MIKDFLYFIYKNENIKRALLSFLYAIIFFLGLFVFSFVLYIFGVSKSYGRLVAIFVFCSFVTVFVVVMYFCSWWRRWKESGGG